MYSFKQHLDEMARRNPEQNPRLSTVEQLMPYFGTPKMWFLSMRDIQKLGINPSNDYLSPHGVYAFPLDDKLKERFENRGWGLPLGAEREHAYLFQIKDDAKILDVNNYVKSNLIRDLDILLENEKFQDAIENFVGSLHVELPPLISGKVLVSKSLSLIKKFLDEDNYYASGDEDDETAYNYRAPFNILLFYLRRVMDKNNIGGKFSSYLNSTLRNLGYQAIYDSGEGIIHPNEPAQIGVLDVRIITNKIALKNSTYSQNEPIEKYIDRSLRRYWVNPNDDRGKSIIQMLINKNIIAKDDKISEISLLSIGIDGNIIGIGIAASDTKRENNKILFQIFDGTFTHPLNNNRIIPYNKLEKLIKPSEFKTIESKPFDGVGHYANQISVEFTKRKIRR